MLPCFAQVVVAATMLIGSAGGTAESCLLEVIGYPATGETIVVTAFDYAPPGTVRTIWAGGGALKLVASPTPDVVHYLGLPNVTDLQVAPLDMLTFVSVGTYYGPQSQSAWILQAITRYQSPGEIPGASRGLTLTTDGQYRIGIDALEVVLCDAGGHCIQQLTPHVSLDVSHGVGAGGIDTGVLTPGLWYLYVIEAPQGPSAIASKSPTTPVLPTPTTTQNNYSWFAPVATATINGQGYVIAVTPLPAR